MKKSQWLSRKVQCLPPKVLRNRQKRSQKFLHLKFYGTSKERVSRAFGTLYNVSTSRTRKSLMQLCPNWISSVRYIIFSKKWVH